MFNLQNQKEIGNLLVPAFKTGRLQIMSLADRKTFSRLVDHLASFGFGRPPFFSSRETVIKDMVSDIDSYFLVSGFVELCWVVSADEHRLWDGSGKSLTFSNFQTNKDAKNWYAATGMQLGGWAFIKIDITSIIGLLQPFLEETKKEPVPEFVWKG